MSVAASEAIRGNAGIVFTIGGTAFDQDTKAVTLTPEDRDDADVTFAEAESGDVTVSTLNLTGIQSTKAGSLWRYLWEHAGEEVAVVYGPHGNALPTADKPHFLVTVKLGNRPSLGGEARRAKDRYDFEHSAEVLEGPTLEDGA